MHSSLNKLFIIIFFPILLFSPSSQSITSQFAEKRELFIDAEKHIWRNKSPKYQTLYKSLDGYPLQPYLDQKRLMHKIRLSFQPEIERFLAKYKNTPLDWPLRKKWLNYLIKKNKPSLFIQAYKANTDSKLTCYYYRYQLAQGHSIDEYIDEISGLWLVGKSQPKECDPLFREWQKLGERTNNIVWKRLALAANGGKHTLIPYLTTLLPDSEQYLGKLWHKVRRDPAYITKLSRFPGNSAKESEIFTYGIKRLIWRDPNRALKTYKNAKKTIRLTAQQEMEIAEKFALALASKQHKSASVWLAKVDDAHLSDNLLQWRIATALNTQNWPKIQQDLESLPLVFKDKLQWKYWHARSLIENKQLDKGEIVLNQLAEKRHYYGFLASSFINKPFNLQDNPLIVSSEEKSLFFSSTSSSAQRAFELFHLGRYHQARLEWNYWLSQLNDRQKLIAAKIANEVQWYDRAIFTLANVGYLDDVDLRFPLAFEQEISDNASKNKINPAWAFAIARRESSFMADAHSSVGAKGLMQIMPDTAKLLERRKVSTRDLLKPQRNIKLGTKYLRKLLDRYDGNNVLATASYNAGPYRVSRWIKGKPAMPADVWIETIPYKETREYVKSVLAYQQIYQHKVGQKGALFDQIISMDIVK